jgi:hypothetical protein
MGQTVCKPGSVPPLAQGRAGWMTIPLGRSLPTASRDLPGRRRENPPATICEDVAGRPYSVLLPVGFTMPVPSLGPRCALTAPFHPYPKSPEHEASKRSGGFLSVALSLGSPPPGVTRHRASMEPGLSSRNPPTSRGPPAVIQPSDPRLT